MSGAAVGCGNLEAVLCSQGLDVLKGSFMTGEAFWAWMGALAVLFGLPLLVRARKG